MPKLKTRPEAIEVTLAKSALVIVDMQNAFASKGGMLDLAGMDISDARRVIDLIRSVLDAIRPAGMPAVYLQMVYKADQSDAGGPNSPNWYKEKAMCLTHERPELKGKVLTEGTWDAAIVDELAPLPSDIVIPKTRYSGFVGTTLDSRLRTRGIQYLFFAGIATNVCVESTIRSAFFLDFWPILLADATMQAGPQSVQDATLYNVESFFGWTMTSQDFIAAIK